MFRSSETPNLEVAIHSKANPTIISPKRLNRKLQQLPFSSRVLQSSLGKMNMVIIDDSKVYVDLTYLESNLPDQDQHLALKLDLLGTASFISSLLKISSGKSVGRLAELLGNITCPECNSRMEVRRGPYSYFLGCIDYPHCSGMRPIEAKWVQIYIDSLEPRPVSRAILISPLGGSDVFLDSLSRQPKTSPVLQWTLCTQRHLNPCSIVPNQVSVKNIDESIYADPCPRPIVKHLVLYPTEEPLTSRIVRWTAFFRH